MGKCTPESLIAGKKIKLTRQRHDVLNAIINIGRPFPAYDLRDDLADEMDLATIYRNLDMLSGEGIIRQVMNENERQYYELACKHNPEHPHFYCSCCGKIFCMGKEKYIQPGKVLSGDFTVEGTVITFKGICPECKKINANNSQKK